MTRERLPDRRASQTIEFDHGPIGYPVNRYTATLSYYDRGMTRLGEVFLNSGKSGAMLDCVMRDSAIGVSVALQYGVPVDELRAAFLKDANGHSESPLGHLLDLLAGGAPAQ